VRTLFFILVGLALFAICAGGAKLLANGIAEPMRAAVIAFCVVWFIVAAVNMWIGVTRAGYSFAEELPIFLVIFGVPALVAVFVKWKWL
jgi:hypothetical protein